MCGRSTCSLMANRVPGTCREGGCWPETKEHSYFCVAVRVPYQLCSCTELHFEHAHNTYIICTSYSILKSLTTRPWPQLSSSSWRRRSRPPWLGTPRRVTGALRPLLLPASLRSLLLPTETRPRVVTRHPMVADCATLGMAPVGAYESMDGQA